MLTRLSSWSRNVQSVPPNYVLPEDQRPGGDVAAPVCKDIPVIDLSQLSGLDRVETIQLIMKANMDLGMFQVINHGVPEELMDETMNLFKEFFNMPAEDKAMYYSEDGTSKGFRIYTSSMKGVNTWKDSVRHICEPLEDNIQSWPEKPARYREVVRAYSVEVRKLSLRILDLVCEGLGIESGYFRDELSKFQELLVHNYPPCPEPGLVLGVGGHTDPSLLTLLQQQDVYGLQIFKGGQWLGVEPIPHAFVINISDQLEVISNGKLKSARHRVVTNADIARTSLVTFINPSLESIIEPEKALESASEPQLFKSFRFKEYRDIYFANLRDPNDATTLDAYKL
ncbi:hyoscyamine 6-dioxygenase-like [Rhododendron vialii]|uniref:hyoscyamine 6-dioxygenase-like n=1 Tax=Rhododendron vialii TaxID=182163 RepID=UPI00265E9291|nr:hyoscyamine 6-dioxygenase-like [Rhododendron vialii]